MSLLFNAIDWDSTDINNEFIINGYGINNDGNNIGLRILNFKPEYFIRIKNMDNEDLMEDIDDRLNSFIKNLELISKKSLYCKKTHDSDNSDSDEDSDEEKKKNKCFCLECSKIDLLRTYPEEYEYYNTSNYHKNLGKNINDEETEIVEKKDLYDGFNYDRRKKTSSKYYDFLKISFNNIKSFNKIKKLLNFEIFYPKLNKKVKNRFVKINGIPICNLKIDFYESSILPLLRFFHKRQIKPVGWIDINKDDLVCIKKEKYFNCNECYEVDWNKINPSERIDFGNFKIMSWDIEADSEYGDFPSAIKEYNKQGAEIADFYLEKLKKNEEVEKNDIEDVLNKMFNLEDEIENKKKVEYINKIYFKKDILKVLRKTPVEYKKFIKKLSSKVYEICYENKDNKSYSKDNKIFHNWINNKKEDNKTENNEEDDDHYYSDDFDSEDEIEKLKSKEEEDELKSNRDIIIYRVNKLFLQKIGKYVRGDRITQIGAVFYKYGKQDEYDKFILTLGSCDKFSDDSIIIDTKDENNKLKSSAIIIEDALKYNESKTKILPFYIKEEYDNFNNKELDKLEKKLILTFKELIIQYNPDMILAFNNFGFDNPFLMNRCKELKLLDAKCNNKFCKGAGKYCYEQNQECLYCDYCKKDKMVPANLKESFNINRLNTETTNLEIKTLSSSALGDNILNLINSKGRVHIDLLKEVQRCYNLESYKLDFIAEKFLGDHKDDVSAQQIFAYQKMDGHHRGIVAKYCFTEETNVSLLHGNIPIKNLINNKSKLLSWDEKENKIILSEQNKFFNNGKHECIELEFIDGRKITCTPDHLIPNENGIWTKAKDFQKGFKAKVGLILPNVSVDNRNTVLSRIIGFILSDGCITKDRIEIYFGNLMDVEVFNEDFKYLYNQYLNYVKKDNDNNYRIHIPQKYTQELRQFNNITYGNRTKGGICLPSNLNKWNLDELREFLGGIFGGDGWSTSLTRNQFSCIGLTQSRYDKNILLNFMKIIKECLIRFNIQSTFTIIKRKNLFIGNLRLPIEETENFVSKIGYRYCYHKTLRSSISTMYYRFKNNVRETYNNFYKLIKEKINNKYSQKQAYNLAIDEIDFNYYMPTFGTLQSWIKKGGVPNNRKEQLCRKFPNARDFIKLINAENIFSKNINKYHTYAISKEQKYLPTFNLEIKNIKNVGLKHVYDIEVKDTHSFIAEGVIVHNCVQDCVLLLNLIKKLDSCASNMGMANVSLIPFSFIFLRGQGIKIQSLVGEFCMHEDTLLKTLDKSFSDDSYEGAVVLPPTVGMYLKDGGVGVLDYASLYPNSMIGSNISHDTIVESVMTDYKTLDEIENLKFDNMREGIKFENLYELIKEKHSDFEEDDIQNLIKDIESRYHIYPLYDSIYIPEIKTRFIRFINFYKIYNKKRDNPQGNENLNIKGYNYVTVYFDTYKGKGDKKRKNGIKKLTFANPVDTEEKGIMCKILKKLLGQRKYIRKVLMPKEPDEFKRGVYEGLQLAYKCSANSLYGQTGSSVSCISQVDLASSTTSTGRQMLSLCKSFAEEYFDCDVVYGDTDSIFLKFHDHIFEDIEDKPILDALNQNLTKKINYDDNTPISKTIKGLIEIMDKTEGKTGLKISILRCEVLSAEIAQLLRPPHDLEYEKNFCPFLLLSKKRYVGTLYEHDVSIGKLKYMGIVLKRRDNAQIVKTIYGGIIDKIMKEKNIESSIQFLHNKLDELIDGKIPIEDLTITKTLRGHYKNRTMIAHACLADRIEDRTGEKVPSNTRIPYAYVNIEEKKGVTYKQGDRIELPSYIKENNLKLDYKFYITNQLMKPILQIYDLEMKNPESVFADAIRKSSNIKTNTNEITKWFQPVGKKEIKTNIKLEKGCIYMIKKGITAKKKCNKDVVPGTNYCEKHNKKNKNEVKNINTLKFEKLVKV